MATPPLPPVSQPPLPPVSQPLVKRLIAGDWKNGEDVHNFSGLPKIDLEHLVTPLPPRGPPPSGPLASDIHLAGNLEKVIQQALCEKCSAENISEYVDEISTSSGNSFGNTLDKFSVDPNKCPKCGGSKMPPLLPDR